MALLAALVVQGYEVPECSEVIPGALGEGECLAYESGAPLPPCEPEALDVCGEAGVLAHGEVMRHAWHSADATHNHPEGVRGAQATADAVFLARTGKSKAEIRAHIEPAFGYDLSAKLDDIRPAYALDVSCQGSVPQSLVAFLESESYEDAVRNAVSLGGDADTMTAIARAVAEAFYGGMLEHIAAPALERLDRRCHATVTEFATTFAHKIWRWPPPGHTHDRY